MAICTRSHAMTFPFCGETREIDIGLGTRYFEDLKTSTCDPVHRIVE